MGFERASFEDLRIELTELAEEVAIGGLYRHYKNIDSRYIVKALCVLKESDVIAVRYSPAAAQDIDYICPVSEWLESVEKSEGETVQRYELVD